MPYIANTPESSVARGDSLDPRKTCNGITCNGQPCKRPLPTAKFGGSADAKYAESCSKNHVDTFCWQHKHQAAQQSTKCTTLRPTTSYDTLIDRLQITDLHQPCNAGDSSELNRERRADERSQHHRIRRSSKGRRPLKLSWLFCCLGSPDDDRGQLEVVRHKTRLQPSSQLTSQPTAQPAVTIKHPVTTAVGLDPTPSIQSTALIPPSLPSHVRSQLLQELSKPISSFDEDGYIYMYRRVDSSSSLTGNFAAAPPNVKVRGGSSGRQMDPLVFHQTAKDSLVKGKILVKIGYTTNVQSRLSAWSGKCGTKVELLRYYPHISSTSRSMQPRKTPSCHRVERLIHIELADKRAQQKCGCGSVHREWFEIAANVEAVKAADEVIRRWVSWAERRQDASSRHFGTSGPEK